VSLRDDLAGLARAGDLAALETLIAALPPELPAAIRRRQRDIEIRRLAADIAALLPGASARRGARVVAAAGARIEAGHSSLSGAEFASFTSGEAAAIASRIALILEYAPAGCTGIRWPGPRQVARIITGVAGRPGVSPAAVVMTRPAA
jgi:hypothetical protein